MSACICSCFGKKSRFGTVVSFLTLCLSQRLDSRAPASCATSTQVTPPQVTSPCVRAVECPMLLMASAAPTITWLPLNVAIVDNDRGDSPSSHISRSLSMQWCWHAVCFHAAALPAVTHPTIKNRLYGSVCLCCNWSACRLSLSCVCVRVVASSCMTARTPRAGGLARV